jgi:lipopolysaccharide transport system ATP-binding protein
MTWAIQVENLSKQYRLGTAVTPAIDSLYEAIEQKLRRVSHHLGMSAAPGDRLRKTAEKQNPNLVLSAQQLEGALRDHFWALRDVSFEINEGDRVGIVGKNGSGKSTLLKILSRITTPSHGLFRFRGRLVSLLEVGTGFHPDLSGRENIFLNAKINGMSSRGIRQMFDNIVDFSELGGQIDTPIKRYSSGMYMRLAFSVAAFLESEILIVDEVLAVGDAGFQKKCLDKMLEISGRGRTLLFVSHDMTAISKLCNKALEMSHGRLVPNALEAGKGSVAIENISSLMTVNDAISGYVLDGGAISERVWRPDNAPSMDDGNVTLTRVAIENQNGVVSKSFDVKDDIFICIDFEVAQPKWLLNVHVYITTLTGQRLMMSMDNLNIPTALTTRPAGTYREICRVRNELLNEGMYRVEVVICTNPTTQFNIAVPDVVTFSVTDDLSSAGVRGDWTREWPDYPIRSRLDWNIQFNKAPHTS